MALCVILELQRRCAWEDDAGYNQHSKWAAMILVQVRCFRCFLPMFRRKLGWISRSLPVTVSVVTASTACGQTGRTPATPSAPYTHLLVSFSIITNLKVYTFSILTQEVLDLR